MGCWCESQHLVVLDELFHYNDKDMQTDIAILDFSEAFDTLPHDELLCKLESYQLKHSIGADLSFFMLYLCYRRTVS